MAGSGTLAIEHALRARRIPPGLTRAFGFQRWPVYRGGPQSAWDRMKEEARAAILPRAPAPIVARDLHPKALAALRQNVEVAGLTADITIEEGDARELSPRVPARRARVEPALRRAAHGRRGRGAQDARVQDRKIAGFYRGSPR